MFCIDFLHVRNCYDQNTHQEKENKEKMKRNDEKAEKCGNNESIGGDLV